ncbi:MAG: DoxX family protein [Phycisphaerales bacterium]
MDRDHLEHAGAQAGLLVARVLPGVVFVFHGSQKLFGAFDGPGLAGFAGYLDALGVPAPALNAAVAASVELVGGLALLTGVGQRIVAAPLAFTMLVAAFLAHGGAFDAGKGGMEYPLTLAFVVIGLGLTGPGRLTLATLARRLRRGAAAGRDGGLASSFTAATTTTTTTAR